MRRVILMDVDRYLHRGHLCLASADSVCTMIHSALSCQHVLLGGGFSFSQMEGDFDPFPSYFACGKRPC